MDRQIIYATMKTAIFFMLIFCSCFQQNTPTKYIYHTFIDKQFRYTIETDFINSNSSLNIYSKTNQKLFEKTFNMVPYIDSVIDGVIYLSKYSSTGTTDTTLKSELIKTDSGQLGYERYSYKVDFFSDNYGGIDNLNKWKFLRLEVDKLVYQDCLTSAEVKVPINSIINYGGELRVKQNTKRGLLFDSIIDCDTLKNRRMDFFNLLFE
jgi:hypothetical protein